MSDDKPVSAGKRLSAIIQGPDLQTKIAQALPPGISKDRFTSCVLTALQNNPGIIEGDRASLYAAIIQSAQTGLNLDGKEAALVIFNTNIAPKGERPQWVKKVQFMPMVGGIIKRLGGAGVTVNTEVVYANDFFELEYGDDPKIVHKPPKFGESRGDMIGAYAICKARDGTVYREVMDKAQIEAVRAQSRAKDSLMWTQFASEGWRKTVLRRCAKRIPINDALADQTMAADDKTFQFGEDEEAPTDQTVVAIQEEPLPPVEEEDQTPPEYREPPAQAQKPAEKASPPVQKARPRALAQALAQDEGDIF